MFLRLILLLLLLLTPSIATAQTDWTLDADCLIAYTFDELTGDAIDLCGSNDGDLDEDPPQRVGGRFFGALNFPAFGMVAIGDVDILDGKDTITMSWWQNSTDDFDDLEHEIIRKDGTLNIQVGSGVSRAYMWTPSGAAFNISDTDYPTDYLIAEDGLWHMYTFIYNGSTVYMYRDCVEVESEARTGSFANSANRMVIGKKPPEEYGPAYSAQSAIDDFIILDRAINGTECTELMTYGIDGRAGFIQPQIRAFNVKMFSVKADGGLND